MTYSNLEKLNLEKKILEDEFERVPESIKKFSCFNSLYRDLDRVILNIENSKDSQDEITVMKNDNCHDFVLKRQFKDGYLFNNDIMHVDFHFDDENNLKKLGMLYINEWNDEDTVRSLYIEEDDNTISAEFQDYLRFNSQKQKNGDKLKKDEEEDDEFITNVSETHDKLGNLISGKYTYYLGRTEVSNELHKVDDYSCYLLKRTFGDSSNYSIIESDKFNELGITSIANLSDRVVKSFKRITESDYLEIKSSVSEVSDNKKLVK